MRLLLGAAEAGFFPGVILYLTYWFPREYRARIVGMFTVAIPVSSFLGSPISAALLGADGWLGLHGWQWMFIMEGLPAILLGLFCLFVLSDKPAGAVWLAADQKAWLDGRLQSENLQKKRVGHISLWSVLWNKYVLVLSITLAGSTAVSSGLQIWQPQIIKSYGLTNMQTGLLNSIPFALASVLMVLWGRRSDETGERVWHTALPLFADGRKPGVGNRYLNSLSGADCDFVPGGNRNLCGQRTGVGALGRLAFRGNRSRRPGANERNQQSGGVWHDVRCGIHQAGHWKLPAGHSAARRFVRSRRARSAVDCARPITHAGAEHRTNPRGEVRF